MKLTEQNARFAVVKTAFHNGGTISFHKSWDAAVKSMEKWIGDSSCTCGCAAVVPVTFEAQKEIGAKGGYYDNECPLYADLPEWDSTSHLNPYNLCR